MKKVDLLYEGKAKKVYTTEDPDILIVDYKDDATAMDGLKKGTIVGKGAINNRMTNHIFKLLEKEGIPTHYVEELSDRETAVKKVEIVPLEVIIRNITAGSFAKKMGVEESFSRNFEWLFEFLVLESAQAGLSWITILRKREGYRKAFYNFDAGLVAQMTDEDVERLMQFDGIVKNRLKIKSTITNARLFLAIQKEFGSFYDYTLSFFPDRKPIINAFCNDLR